MNNLPVRDALSAKPGYGGPRFVNMRGNLCEDCPPAMVRPAQPCYTEINRAAL